MQHFGDQIHSELMVTGQLINDYFFEYGFDGLDGDNLVAEIYVSDCISSRAFCVLILLYCIHIGLIHHVPYDARYINRSLVCFFFSFNDSILLLWSLLYVYDRTK